MAVERFPVEASHILMFARSIGDPNPIYADAEYAAGTEVGAVPRRPRRAGQRPVRPRIRPAPIRPWARVRREATGIRSPPAAARAIRHRATAARSMSGGLHAEQHFEYHRPLSRATC
jgi:hypothetical protein